MFTHENAALPSAVRLGAVSDDGIDMPLLCR